LRKLYKGWCLSLEAKKQRGVIMPKVTVDFPKCNGDGSCVGVCPVGVFELQNRPDFNGESKAVPVNGDSCIACRACETQCPTQAIKVED